MCLQYTDAPALGNSIKLCKPCQMTQNDLQGLSLNPNTIHYARTGKRNTYHQNAERYRKEIFADSDNGLECEDIGNLTYSFEPCIHGLLENCG